MSNEEDGIEWWNNLTESERKFWLEKAESARPVDAFEAFKSEEEESNAPR